MSQEKLNAALTNLAQKLKGVDLDDAESARAEIEAAIPFGSETVAELRELARAGYAEGWLTPKEAGGVKFGRLAKDLEGFSIDAVYMNGPGPRHRHPKGEIDLCFADVGEAKFDGHSEGWVVYGPDSVHVPTVSDGEMLILYFLPEGAMEFLK